MEGVSPDQESVESGAKKSSIPSGGRLHDRKEFLHRFVDSESLTENIKTWYEETIENSTHKEPSFDVPFELIDLQKFDYALGGVPFQQLIRMPSAVYASTSGAAEATAYLALEDFLHASVKGLWEAFWGQDETLPFYVSCVYNSNLRFYQAEKAISKGKLGGLCATAVMLKNPRHPQGKWDDILELAILRSDIGNLCTVENDCKPCLSILGEALFFALRVLVARSISRSNIPLSLNSVFVLLVDTQYGGVLKLEGDVSKLEMDLNDVYGCAAEWIKNNALITISPIDRIWNKLGNANWGDVGALQALYATFHSITQYAGMSKNSIEDLAADHSARLQARRIERQLGDSWVNGNGLFRYQQRSASPEIVEVHEESFRLEPDKSMNLEIGSVVLIEDSNWKKDYQINEVLTDGEIPYYIASSVEDPGTTSFLYVGSHPSLLEPAWEDMKLWYQVQRQTKVLGVMKQKELSSKYLPQLDASGRIIHPGQCRRPSSGGNCDRQWCGTPVLMTSPVGRTVADLVRLGHFGSDEAIRCCHDCLAALSAAASVGIRHGDIRPENVVFVNSGVRQPYFVLVGWGHAILEERDRPAMNLHFSSTYALQEGKLCSASDAESLVYMLYFSSGSNMPTQISFKFIAIFSKKKIKIWAAMKLCMKPFSCILLCCMFLLSSIYIAKAEVITLTGDTFNDKISEKDTAWFVKFCVPWCKHCKNLGTLWDDLGKTMEREDEIEVGQVDCGTDKPVCNKVDIHSYPTFKLFYNGEEVAKYQGPRDIESLKVFALEEAEKAATKAEAVDDKEL